MSLFKERFGVIIACDVKNDELLDNIVSNTCETKGIVGYKIGAILALKYGLQTIVDRISRITDLPLIYDHQKFGTDIPDFCGGDVLKTIKQAGVDALIIFPQSGPETLRVCLMGREQQNPAIQIQGCLRTGLIPIVGAVMTHPMYLESEGGYVIDRAPQMIFENAASYGVEYYVLPSTKLGILREYCNMINNSVKKPHFLFPGIGKSQQGGDIHMAFKCAGESSCYAIVGREIYLASDITKSAERYGKIVTEMNDVRDRALLDE